MVGNVENLKPLPTEGRTTEEGVALYEERFRGQKAIWGEILEENVHRVHSGSYSLHWLNPEKYDHDWGKRPKISSRGLTYDDINRMPGSGEMPEVADWRGLSPRGSIREPWRDRMPVIEAYDVLMRREVDAKNVTTLYEEAKARQWNATRDIPWNDLERLPEDLEKATCQLATFLTEVEFVAGDFPCKWMYRIPQDFLEVKSFLSTQIMDEARHQEVFRKRAMMGGGLLCSSPGFEWALAAILEAPTHTMGTFLLNLLGEGLVLSVFRSGELVAATHTDKEIFRLCMQDEARHVSYGVMEFKNYIDTAPDREAAIEELHRFADVGEQLILTTFSEAALIEPLAVLLGRGVKNIDQGMDGVVKLWQVFIEEYLARCERAGFPRRERCTIPINMPWASHKAA